MIEMKDHIVNKEVTTKSDVSSKEFSTKASTIPPVKSVSGTIDEVIHASSGEISQFLRIIPEPI